MLASNLMQHSLPHLYALLEAFLLDAPQLRHYSLFDGLHVFKTGPLDDFLELREKEKSRGARSGE